jgi:two-component system, NtrC family, response regulator
MTTNPRLLIVDDDEEIRSQMKWALTQDYEVFLAEDRSSAVDVLRSKRPQVVLLDLGLPPLPADPSEGLAALSDLLGSDAKAKVIIITGQGDKANALKAIGSGAYDFLVKPAQIDELKIILRRAFYVAQLERECHDIQQRVSMDTFEGMLGTSSQMQDVFSTIKKVATADAPVLILGESGTGKEMTALAIHRRSRRKDGPFIPINCSAIPETLLESELFGHEKGSFTGAHMQRMGRIETAAGGTLFLDEIGELPLAIQVKLLRFLQEQRIERVGGRKQIEIDTRVIAATNVDLKKGMADGKFREDLYYRLAVVVMRLPSLRERIGDIPLLAQAFLQRFTPANRKSALKLDLQAMAALEEYAWPGNVRELENRVKRAVIMADGPKITLADLELAAPSNPTPNRNLRLAREELERQMTQQALFRHNGNISSAALDLGISRPTLYELMEKLGIKREPNHDTMGV